MIPFPKKEVESKMSMDKRALFKSVMIGFMTDEDPMLAMPKWISG